MSRYTVHAHLLPNLKGQHSMISPERVKQLTLEQCEEILHTCDKALMLGTSAPEEMIAMRDQVRERHDELTKTQPPSI